MRKLIAAVLSIVPATALAADAGCKGNPALTGQCYSVSGDVLLSADIGVVLGPDGKNRALVVRAAPNSEIDMPESVSALLSKKLTSYIHGVYEVCPIPAEPNQFVPGETKYICINSASKLYVDTTK